MATLFSQFMLNNFNPRTREGCDAVSLANVDKALQISIHAPVKGATQKEVIQMSKWYTFQSTHP